MNVFYMIHYCIFKSTATFQDKKELSRAIAMATDQTEVHAIDEGIQPSKVTEIKIVVAS